MVNSKKITEQIEFSWQPEFNIVESAPGWIKIGGTALVEGLSKNNNFYSKQNLEENSGKEFKWLFGHPAEPETHVVGKGSLSLSEGKLVHGGKIRNTASHPDVVESVRDGFLGPSIHASAKVTNKDGVYHVEGLSIDGIGLVAFQGVKGASIDYAIAESFNKKLNEMKESAKDVNNKDKGDVIMEEEKPVEPAKEEPKVEEPAKEEPKAEEPAKEEEPAVESEALKKVQEELKEMKEARESEKKEVLVESIRKINSKMDKVELMERSLSELELIKAYESKSAGRTSAIAIVESDDKGEATIEEKNGALSFSKPAWEKFNQELRESEVN